MITLEIFPRVFHDTLNAAIESGITPTEVWIGNDARVALYHFIRERTGYSCRLDRSGTMSLHGLTVRFMDCDGIRVGTSVSPGENLGQQVLEYWKAAAK